jgi:lauroyl/myristoyl acyltransferase
LTYREVIPIDSVNPALSQPPLPLAKNQSSHFSLHGKGYRLRFYKILYEIYRAVERIGGAAAIPWLMAPLIGWDLVKRRRDFPQFVRLRNALPPEFWKGLGPRQHYFRMIQVWYEMIGTGLVYDRSGLPYWQKRFQVKGTPPQALPEWGARPMILAFLHTGSFGLNRYWLRSRGIPCASLVAMLPSILENEFHQKILDAGDLLYGLEGVPQTFKVSGGMRNAIRFLKPGRVLIVPLDGGNCPPDLQRYDAGGFPLLAHQGACRLAAQTNAVVIPVALRRTAACQFEIRFGKPVPDALIQKKNFAGATQHLISELWADLKENPGDLNWTTLEALSPALKAKRIEWP